MSKEKITPEQSALFWADIQNNIAELMQWGKPSDHRKTLDVMLEAVITTNYGDDTKERNEAWMLHKQLTTLLKTIKKHGVKFDDIPTVQG